MSSRKPRPPHPPWWHNWPQLRIYRGIDTAHVIRYERWGTHCLVWWCPACWAAIPYPLNFATEMAGDLRMKRPTSAPGAPGGKAAPADDLAALFPLLAEHLTSTSYDDDPPTARQTSTLLIFAQDGSYRACLRDRQEQRCLWIAAREWGELLPVLEEALGDPDAVWRDDRLSGHETAKRHPAGRKPA